MSGLKRLFFGAPLPASLQTALRDEVLPKLEWENARWIPPENYHITLFFLGATSIPPETISSSIDASRAAGPFQASLRGIGAFPDFHRARVAWAGIHQGRKELIAIHELIALSPLLHELRETDRDYHPHLTLARFRHGQRLSLPAPDTLPDWQDERWRFSVDRLILYESLPVPGGVRYERLEIVPL